jgi:hypothetical protein
MSYIFIDDGYPDARDYDSNYLYYDPDDLEQMEQILQLLERRSKKHSLRNTPSKRILLNAIERRRRTSFEVPTREPSGDVSVARKALGIVERCYEAVSNS